MASQRVSLVCILLIAVFFLSGDTTAAPQSSIAPGAQQIGDWIADLDSDNYTTREQATRSLVSAGRSAISSIAKAALSDNPEVSWRAGSILEQIGLAGNDATLAEVVGAMQQLSESGRKSFDESRSLLVAKWRQARHDRAATRLQQLGAVIQDVPNGWAFDAVGGFGGIAVEPFAVFDFREDGVADDADATDLEAKTDERVVVKNDAEPKKAEEPAKKETHQPKQATKPAVRELDGELSKKVDKLVLEKLKALDRKEVEIENDATVDVKKPVIKPLEIRPLEDKAADEKAKVEEVERVVVEIADDLDAPIMVGGFDFVLPPPMLLDLGGVVWHDESTPNGARTVSIGKTWKGTDDDLGLLAHLDRVATVSINELNLSKKAIGQIARMRQLKRIEINRSQFHRESMLGLKQKRSNVSIYATGETVLGVSGSQDPNGFKVTHVAPKSGAQKVGIRIGDVLTDADGVKLKSLDELTLVVAPKKVGDKLALRFLRDGKSISAQATLGSRAATGVNAHLLHEFIEDSVPVPLIDPK